GLLLDVAHQGGGLALGLVLEAPLQLLLRFLGAQARDLLEPGARLQLAHRQDLLAVAEALVAPLQLAVALLQRARPLIELLLPPLELAAPARRLLLRSLARQEQLLLRREHDALLRLLQPLALGRRRLRHGLRHPALDAASQDIEGRSRSGGAAQEGEEHARPCAHGTYLRQHPAGKAEREKASADS